MILFSISSAVSLLTPSGSEGVGRTEALLTQSVADVIGCGSHLQPILQSADLAWSGHIDRRRTMG